jgi:hypothetical protein
MPRQAKSRQALCADIGGFSLHAAVRCAADDRQALEQPCRCVTRPALADDRGQCNAAARVVLKLKTPWRNGTTHLVMSPVEFMHRLAALVARPRLHLIRFHGVLAPNAKLRAARRANCREQARHQGQPVGATCYSASAGATSRAAGHSGRCRADENAVNALHAGHECAEVTDDGV